MRDGVWVAATLLFLAGALSTLTKNGLWNDEWMKQYAFSAERPEYPYASGEAHRLHFFIGRSWARLFGVGPFALRFPWALFAAGCIPLSYLMGRVAGDRRLGRIACVMTATSSYLLFYAQDANYYAEMMFYALAETAALWVFLETGGLGVAALGLAALAALYLVHPFGAVCGGALALGAAIGSFGSPPARSAVLGLLRVRGVRPPIVALKLAILVAAGFGVFRFHLLSRLLSDGTQFLKQFHVGGSYTNTALNGRFIGALLREFGPSVVSKTPLTTALSWVYPPLAVLGAAALFARRPWPALMVALVFVVTVFVMFFFKVDRFFHLRYISYVVPLYLLAVAAGLWRLGEWIEKVRPGRPLAWATPTLALLALISPGIREHLSFDGAYLKKVENYLKERWTPDDRLVTYQMIWPITPFTPAGIPPEQHIVMPGLVTIGQGWLDNAFFKSTLVDHPAAWLLHHWNEPRTINEPLLRWADRWMTRVVEAPSIFENSPIQWYNREPQPLALPLVAATLHRWDWPDRYVVAPKPLRLDLARESERPRFEFKKERGLIHAGLEADGRKLVWRSPFLFEHLGAYRFELAPSAALRGSHISMALNGQPLAGGSEKGTAIFHGEVATMENKIEIEVDANDPAPLENLLPTLQIDADLKQGFKIHPFYFNPPDPQVIWLLSDVEESGRPRLTFKRNWPLTYRLNVAQEGPYRLAFEVIEDRPGTVVFDLVVDGAPMVLLAFAGANNQWGTRQVVLPLTRGAHDLTVTFLSEIDVMATDPDADNDLILGGIEVKGAGAAERDDRLALAGHLVSSGGLRGNFADFALPDKLGAGWNYGGDARLGVEADAQESGEITLPDPSGKVVSLTFASSAKGAQLAAPPLRVTPGQNLYFDLDARCDVEGKHSANLRIQYFDSEGRGLGGLFARGSDVNARTGWLRYAYFGAVPPGAAHAVVDFVFYRNSRGFFPLETRFYFRRFRVIDAPAPR